MQVLAINSLSIEAEQSKAIDAFIEGNNKNFKFYKGSGPSEPDFLLIIDEVDDHQKELLIDLLGEEERTQIEDICAKSKHLKSKIQEIDLSNQKETVLEMVEHTKVMIDRVNAANATIKEDFIRESITDDISTLLAKVEQYQTSIDEITGSIKMIEKRKRILSENFNNLFKISQNLGVHWSACQQAIDEKWKQLKDNGTAEQSPQRQLIDRLLADIEISAEIYFDVNIFYQTIEGSLDKNRFRKRGVVSSSERILKTLGISDVNSFLRLINNEKVIELDEVVMINLGEKVLSKSLYQNKEPFELSIGQRGTFYVCLKLATDTFGLPFVFDQPEDDLDNDFIANELVEMFKEIKKYRQVIIVTHNANLCVNADAEQVIVASNDREIISYESGALEKPDIRRSVYTILEGGEDAFLKRERKYDFQKNK